VINHDDSTATTFPFVFVVFVVVCQPLDMVWRVLTKR